MPSDLAVDLVGLRKHFGARRALAGVDLTLPHRRIVGVVGPDGAGKTTLIRALAGLLEVQAQHAEVLGYSLLDEDVSDLKRRIGYVPQAFSLHRDLSVIENLRFTGRLQRIPTAEFDRRAHDLLQRTGLARFATRVAGALSGGMKQKLAVANALLAEPELILLDEPTAGVDVTSRAEIWRMLVAARERALVILSTSYLEEAEACDELIYLDDGRVVAQGTPAALRDATPVEVFRVWGERPAELARAARQLPYVAAARPNGTFARVEVGKAAALACERLREELTARVSQPIHLIERDRADIESTLLHLARGAKATA